MKLFTPRSLATAAAVGSATLLLAAFAFQALGYAPCALCIWQRWPHAAAILIGTLALAWRPCRLLMAAGALAAASSAAVAGYHMGVEWGVFEGLASCTGGSLVGLSADELLSTEGGPTAAKCGEVVWSLWGLSMAGWNGALSIGLSGIWLLGLWSTRRAEPLPH